MNDVITICCCFFFQTQQDKGEEASGGVQCPASPAPPNNPPPPSRPTYRWHVIARHWLRQTRCRTSGVLPVTTRTTRTSRKTSDCQNTEPTKHSQHATQLCVASNHEATTKNKRTCQVTNHIRLYSYLLFPLSSTKGWQGLFI